MKQNIKFRRLRTILIANFKEVINIMGISITNLSPLASLIFGILILAFPKFLNYWVAAYLIITGLLGLGLLN